MEWLGSEDDGDPLARVALDVGEIIPKVIKKTVIVRHPVLLSDFFSRTI